MNNKLFLFLTKIVNLLIPFVCNRKNQYYIIYSGMLVQINPRLIVLPLNLCWQGHDDACFGSPFDVVDFVIIIVAERIRTPKTERTIFRSHRRNPQVGIRGGGFAIVIIKNDSRLKTRSTKTSKNNNRFLCYSKPNSIKTKIDCKKTGCTDC